MGVLLIAALVRIGIHIGIAGTWFRDVIVARIGDGPFRGLFSLLSIVVIVFLVQAWSATETTPLWYAPVWLRWCSRRRCWWHSCCSSPR